MTLTQILKAIRTLSHLIFFFILYFCFLKHVVRVTEAFCGLNLLHSYPNHQRNNLLFYCCCSSY